jgi:hypothetical protein
MDSDRGFVAIEFVLGIGLLVVPVALLVLTLPGWSERQSVARVIAREAAVRVAAVGICDSEMARQLGAAMAENLAVPVADITVRLGCLPGAALPPESEVEADVTVTIPGVVIPGIGTIGAWSWTARHREPVDRYAAARP